MKRITCIECKQCNRKGKPSVTRFSKYCDTHYIHKTKVKKGMFNWFTNLKNKYYEKRVKYDKDGKPKDLNTKGFRKSWFWR